MITCILADWSQIVLRDLCLCQCSVGICRLVFLMSGLVVPVVTLNKALFVWNHLSHTNTHAFAWLGTDIRLECVCCALYFVTPLPQHHD